MTMDTDKNAEWVRYFTDKGFVVKDPDAPPEETDWVGVNKIQESGPEFLDYSPRFLPPAPDPESTDYHVSAARLVPIRAEDGGYAIYRYVEATHEWTMICGYGPGAAPIALMSLALLTQLTDERVAAGLPVDEESWDAYAEPKWKKSAALYNICRRIVKINKEARRAR